jgi:hypothetical protein
MAILKRQDMSQDEWQQRLRQLAPPQGEPAWMIVETHLDCQLVRFDPSHISEHSYRGRIFCCSGEWKWRLLPDVGYRCVFLGESDWSQLAQDDSAQLARLIAAERAIALWGEYNEKHRVWLEQKIPRHFEHPVDVPGKKKSRVVLVVEEWQSPGNGQVQFVRYRQLKNQV